ncbi:hypothetical protein, partial [Escherichia coli]|uniref:hypothetical protein n=1 Tax=Escherichia coli TaxID=562 RepID=UPI0020339E5C
MSVTESKAKTERKSSRKPSKVQETVLSALLAQTEEVSVPLASLIKSPLNVVTNGAIVIHTQRLKSDPGGNLL